MIIEKSSESVENFITRDSDDGPEKYNFHPVG